MSTDTPSPPLSTGRLREIEQENINCLPESCNQKALLVELHRLEAENAWLRGELEASEDIRAGRTERFANVEDAIKALEQDADQATPGAWEEDIPSLIHEIHRLQSELSRYSGMRTAAEVRGRLEAHRENAERRHQEYDQSGDMSYLEGMEIRAHKIEELKWVLGIEFAAE